MSAVVSSVRTPAYPATLAALTSGDVVNLAWLAEFQFADGTVRLWPGFTDVVHGGYTWTGAGEMIGIEDVALPRGFAAGKITFTLSGVDPAFGTRAAASDSLVKGRKAVLYRAHFTSAWAALDSPFAMGVFIMDQLSFRAQGPSQRSVSLTCESPFATRRRPKFGTLTDADQQARWPGDVGLNFAASLTDKQVTWPSGLT